MTEKFIRNTYVYGNDFWNFYNFQKQDVQDKIDWVIDLVRRLKIVPEKFFKHLEGSNGLFELRVKIGNNIYRIFCCFDEGNLVILFNGFQKKTEKTPRQEIERAERLKKEYFEKKINRK